ncbi:MAG: TIGR03013 family XrtA/PEP-CTERM system glycosyltransferase [Steroidobacteraceae bacterium]
MHVSLLGLALVEAAICYAAPFAAAAVRFGAVGDDVDHESLALPASMFAMAMFASMAAMGLYAPRQRARTGGVTVRLVAAAMLASLMIAVLVYALPGVEFGRGILLLTVLGAVGGCFIARMALMHVLDEELMKRRVLVYGAGRRAQSLMQLRRRTDRRGFHVVGFVCGSDAEILVPKQLALDTGGSLYQLARTHNASEIVVALDDMRKSLPIEALLHCRVRGLNVIDIVSFLERETGKLRIDIVNPSWLIFSGGFRRNPLREGLERGFDVIAALLLLALAWPLMLLTAVAIKLEDGWRAPVFYRQERVGLEGRHFMILKFRSMRIDAEQDGRAAWASENDPRVTRVGALIRKLRIDELPQLFNVLAGDMCFVGPRPERPQFVQALGEKIPYYQERHWVKPGITGWAQLCYPYGASERDAKEKLQYDLYYVKHRNLGFDLMILLETAEVVLWGRGAR